MKHQLNRIDASEARVDKEWESYIKQREQCGLYCCSELEEETMNRCMCVFTSEKRKNTHVQKGKHNFPAPDLKTHVHQLHLSGRFAFCLATGTMTNRCNAANTTAVDVKDGKSEPREHDEVNSDWYKPGCYRAPERSYFRATNALIDDLEALFLDGFRRDGAKKGSNKYTPERALAFLRNLRLPSGRRKYSPDKSNSNGPLPATEYIKSWFSRRKSKMAEVERDKENMKDFEDAFEDIDNEDEDILLSVPDNYDSSTFDELKKIGIERLGGTKLTKKKLLSRLLELDDELHKRDRRIYREKVDRLVLYCKARRLPTDMKKESILQLLRCDDKALRIRNHSLTEGRNLDRTIEETMNLEIEYARREI